MIYLVAGARPNFMKIAPLSEEMRKANMKFKIVHSGQHYDKEMSDIFFTNLGLSSPDIHLGVGSGSHAAQTARIMMAFEKLCLKKRPALVIVVGDVNSTAACAMVTAKMGIPLAHVEAGLRSFDRSMPEEINRLVTDQLSDFLFTTCREANQNLMREGIEPAKIFFVGNVMIDTLKQHLGKAKTSNILRRLGLKTGRDIQSYALLTLHRPSNVDDPVVLEKLVGTFSEFSNHIPFIFPVHPRTLKQLKKLRLDKKINFKDGVVAKKRDVIDNRFISFPPVGYLDFLCLMAHARLVLTDSGGIQEETTILGIPCLTLRSNTERPITLKQGTNTLVGNNPAAILNTGIKILRRKVKKSKIPEKWDGKAAQRIVNILKKIK